MGTKHDNIKLRRRFKCRPEEILYLDDQKANLENPKKMGVKTILYKNFHQLKKELRKYLRRKRAHR